MVAFKGQLSLKWYMPMKPVKHGIKVWECVGSSNGYCFKLHVYTGRQDDGQTEHGLAYRVVRELTQPFLQQYHDVYCDNFFTVLWMLSFFRMSRKYKRKCSWSFDSILVKNWSMASLPDHYQLHKVHKWVVIGKSSKGWCKYCLKNKKTVFFCMACHDCICLDCFLNHSWAALYVCGKFKLQLKWFLLLINYFCQHYKEHRSSSGNYIFHL